MPQKLIPFVLLLLISFACKNPRKSDCNFSDDTQPTDSCMGVEYLVENFEIRRLDLLDMPYADGYSTMNERPHRDQDSIPLLNYHDTLYYHPVYLAQYALEMYDVMLTTGDTTWLPEIVKVGDKLIDLGEMIDSSIFFRYTYNYHVHDCESELMKAPWYSAMAQGQVLSLMCRLHQLTGHTKYLEVSTGIFNSLQRIKGKNQEPWTACIDENQYLWYEEFPNDIPFHTLNGMIFTLYGLYDYYLLTGNEEAKHLLQAGMFTIKENIHLYRREGNSSYYCLRHKYVDDSYHALHIQQLEMLYHITSDNAFADAATTFKNDWSAASND